MNNGSTGSEGFGAAFIAGGDASDSRLGAFNEFSMDLASTSTELLDCLDNDGAVTGSEGNGTALFADCKMDGEVIILCVTNVSAAGSGQAVAVVALCEIDNDDDRDEDEEECKDDEDDADDEGDESVVECGNGAREGSMKGKARWVVTLARKTDFGRNDNEDIDDNDDDKIDVNEGDDVGNDDAYADENEDEDKFADVETLESASAAVSVSSAIASVKEEGDIVDNDVDDDNVGELCCSLPIASVAFVAIVSAAMTLNKIVGANENEDIDNDEDENADDAEDSVAASVIASAAAANETLAVDSAKVDKNGNVPAVGSPPSDSLLLIPVAELEAPMAAAVAGTNRFFLVGGCSSAGISSAAARPCCCCADDVAASAVTAEWAVKAVELDDVIAIMAVHDGSEDTVAAPAASVSASAAEPRAVPVVAPLAVLAVFSAAITASTFARSSSAVVGIAVEATAALAAATS